jgi:hypothetical protein
MSLREARSILQRRLQEREANFLRSAKHGIFENPGNPYLALLDLAGCEWGDLERMVHDRGLEDTLRLLRSSGVYVSFEEFKGQRPIVRNGRVIQTSPDDFNNPTFRRYFTAATGGSTGVPRRVMIDVEYWRSRLPSQVLKSHANGVAGAPLAVWAEIPPGYGLEPALLGVSHDVVPDRWFTPVWKGRDGPGWRFRLATQLAIGVARRVDRRVPRPEYLPIDRAEVIVQWARETLETHARCGIIAHVSKALRIALDRTTSARRSGRSVSAARPLTPRTISTFCWTTSR